MDLGEVSKGLGEATEAFKQMQIALLVFAAMCGVSIVVVSIAIFKSSNNG